MKRQIAYVIIMMFVISVISGCSNQVKSSSPSVTQGTPKNTAVTTAPEQKLIKIWGDSKEIVTIIDKFKTLYPDFGYEIEATDLSNADSNYQVILDQALATGGEKAPDLYGVDATYAIRYTQGDAYQHAAPYQDLGIDVDHLLKEAKIAQYCIDIGTNPDGQLVGLGYQSTEGVFVYRRSIAKAVWGTEDPNAIKAVIGPGWDKFLSAAKELKAKGYGICSSIDDIWQPVFHSANQKWVVDGKLVIDPKREEFLDLAMELKKKGYTNNTTSWTDQWFKDINDGGKKKIFGFFAPAWFINYVMIAHSGGEKVGQGTFGDWAVCEPTTPFYQGGTWILANKNTGAKEGVGKIVQWITLDTTENGLQSLWANNKLGFGAKDTTISSQVMSNTDGSIEFLGGQNLFETFLMDGDKANGKNITKDDETINYYWKEQVLKYTSGKKSREQAIADFEQEVASNLDIKAE